MGPRGLLASRSFAHTLLAVTALAVLAPAGLRAQAAVRVDALVGFNGTAREGRFTPVILSIENPGGRQRAQVSLSVTWGTAVDGLPGWTMSRQIVLDAGATRRLPFVIPFPRDARRLLAVVTAQGAEVGRFQADLRPFATAGRIVAAVSSDLSFDALSSTGSGGASLRVVYPRVDDLPQSWAGYDGVDAVIVHDTYFQQLRADQVDALERWVVTGGVLVFTGGAAALQHEPAGFGRLLPVRVTGLAQRIGLEVAAGGAVQRLPGRVEVAESTVVNGTVLAADGSLPVAVRRDLGRGAVWFLAFDPSAAPASSWGGIIPMWRTILQEDRVPAMGEIDRPSRSDTAIQDPWVAGLFESSPASFPQIPAVLIFTGAYLALLAPILAGRRRRGMKARVRLVLLGAVSVCAAIAAWVVFNRVLFHPGLQVVDAATVESRSGDGLAILAEKVGTFSSSARAIKVRLRSPSAVLEAAPWRAAPDGPWVQPRLAMTQASAVTEIRGLQIDRLSSRLVAFEDVLPFAVTVRVATGGGSVEAKVSNATDRVLHACVILAAGRAYPLGEVAAGASIEKTFDASQAFDSAADVTAARDPDRRHAAMLAVLDPPRTGASAPARLVGWMDGPALPLLFDDARPLGGRPGVVLVSVEAE